MELKNAYKVNYINRIKFSTSVLPPEEINPIAILGISLTNTFFFY
jgi:hypothetical protein